MSIFLYGPRAALERDQSTFAFDSKRAPAAKQFPRVLRFLLLCTAIFPRYFFFSLLGSLSVCRRRCWCCAFTGGRVVGVGHAGHRRSRISFASHRLPRVASRMAGLSLYFFSLFYGPQFHSSCLSFHQKFRCIQPIPLKPGKRGISMIYL